MSPKHKNVYERSSGQLKDEAERLRTFDMPTQASIAAIGDLTSGEFVLDIGAGENLGLSNYVQGHKANYVALDTRHEALMEQKENGALVMEGDARSLPKFTVQFDVSHARFVLAHFVPSDQRRIVNGSLACIKPDGKAIFIDYDWTAMSGSDVVTRLRDFTLGRIKNFDASFGAESKEKVSDYAGEGYEITEQRTHPPKIYDYRPAVGLREVTLKSLELSEGTEEEVAEVNEIFDDLEREAASGNPPGFHMPDIVALVVKDPKLVK